MHLKKSGPTASCLFSQERISHRNSPSPSRWCSIPSDPVTLEFVSILKKVWFPLLFSSGFTQRAVPRIGRSTPPNPWCIFNIIIWPHHHRRQSKAGERYQSKVLPLEQHELFILFINDHHEKGECHSAAITDGERKDVADPKNADSAGVPATMR